MARVIGTAIIDVKADTTSFRRSMDGLGNVGGGIGSKLAVGIGSAGVAVGAVAAQMGMRVEEAGRDMTIALDNARAMFQGVTGDADTAGKMVDQFKQYAVDTPFNVGNLSEMGAKLLAVGQGFGVTTDNILTKFVPAIGNVVTATGGGNLELDRIVRVLGQMSSSGKVLGQDMNQLAQSLPGVDVWGVLAEGAGKSKEELRKLQDEGKLDELMTGNEAVALLIAGMEKFPGAAGAMERKMQTLEGSIEKFRETVGVAASTGLAPFYETLTRLMSSPQILSGIESLISGFAKIGTGLLGGLAPVLPLIMRGLEMMLNALLPLEPVITVLGKALGQVFMAAAPIIFTLAQALSRLTPIVEPLIGVLLAMADVIVSALTPFIGPLVDLLLQIASTVLPPLTRMMQTLAPVIATVATVIAGLIAQHLSNLIELLAQTLVAVEPLLPVLGELLVAALTALAPLFSAVIDSMIPFAPILLDILTAAIPILMVLTQLAVMLVEWLAPAFEKVAEWIRKFALVVEEVRAALKPLIDGIIGIFQYLYDVLVGNSIIPDLIDRIVELWNGLWGLIEGIMNGIRDVIVGIWNGIKFVVEGIVNGIVWYVTTVWDGLKTAIEGIVNAIKSVVQSTLNGMATIISDIFNGVKGAVTTVWNGIKDAITGPIDAAWRFVKDKVNAIGNLISNIPGAGFIGDIAGGIGSVFSANGRIVDKPTLTWVGEGYRKEAIIPLTNPGRAMQLMQQSGLDRLASQMNGGGGPIVSMPGAVIQDATDVDLVAQRVLVAMQSRMLVS